MNETNSYHKGKNKQTKNTEPPKDISYVQFYISLFQNQQLSLSQFLHHMGDLEIHYLFIHFFSLIVTDFYAKSYVSHW